MSIFASLISVEELRANLGKPDWRIIDCRHDLMRPEKGRVEYRQEHIPGAQYANLDEDLAAPVTESTGRHPLPSPEVFAKTLGRWGIDNDKQVVVYDHATAAVAARLWWMLRWVGHEEVAVLDGGYAAWQKAGLPVSKEEPHYAPACFHPHTDERRVISTDELRALIDSGSAPAVVDARDAQRFAGRREPIDTVAGHVPGAVNHPFTEAVDASGHWKHRDRLRTGWKRVLGERRDRPWVAMCGSGVTACHLALSAGLAGYRQPRLYIGSWSEWIRDPSRPVATGCD